MEVAYIYAHQYGIQQPYMKREPLKVTRVTNEWNFSFSLT